MGAILSRVYGTLFGNPGEVANFLYSEGLDAQHVRLLEFVRPPWYTFGLRAPRLQMTKHSLYQLPKFVALSYTWGNPQSTEDSGREEYRDAFPVTVNDQKTSVLRNLRDALNSLLKLWNFEDDVQHMWIDAICIDQKNLTERAAQMGIMGDIYKRAETTVVWLGKATKENKAASRMFDKICRVPAKELMHHHNESPSATPPPAEFWLRHGLPATDDASAWRPVNDFFRHSWFSRAWIIQEVTLSARNIHLFWGKNSMTWEELGHISFVCQFSMIGKLETGPALSKYLSGDENPDEELDWVVSDPIINSFQLWSNRQRYLHRSQNPAEDVMCEDMIALTGCSTPTAASWLLYFSLINRRSKASDLRDKIFCNLGLANNIANQENLNPCPITPSYSPEVTFAHVCQQVVVEVIEETQSLAVLMALNDPPRLRRQELPSWVPDFSRNHGLDLMWSIRPQYNASRNMTWHRSLDVDKRIRVDGTSLHVRGKVLGFINTLSVTLADLVSPRWYRWTQHLIQLDPTYPYTGESRIEAFWRTLLMDSVARQHPARWSGSEDGEMFRAYIIQSMARHYPEPSSETSPDHYLHDLRYINILSETDQSSCMPSFRGLRGLTSLITGVSEDNLENLDESVIIAALTDSADKASKFIIGMDGSMVNRRLVISDHGHLINSPLWAKTSDKLVIIDGCPCPVILRSEGEQSSSCILIGTAYVHGLMNGEFQGSEDAWEDFCII